VTDSPETGSTNGVLSFADTAANWSKLLFVGPHLQATMLTLLLAASSR
jgi:hypothetical protein